ncbi:MAG: hypothetical protein AAGJ46_19670 [Planctomycetota bacterium]
MLTVSPNAGLSLRLANNGARAQSRIGQAIERLSTGKRINRPSDDRAGFVGAEQLRGELTEVKAELKGFAQQELTLKGRESRLATIQRGLNSLQGRIIEASNSVISDSERDALQIEVEETIAALNRVAGDFSLNLSAVQSGGPASLDGGDPAAAAALVEAQSSATLHQRAAVAAEQRQLGIYERLAQDREVILTEALSQAEDADFAEEASNLAIAQTLNAAANAAKFYSQQTHSDLIGELLDEVDVSPSSRE